MTNDQYIHFHLVTSEVKKSSAGSIVLFIKNVEYMHNSKVRNMP